MYFSCKEIELKTLYDFLIPIAGNVLKIPAQFNTKLRLGVEGRKRTFSTLRSAISKTDKTLWFHCASLGEYEQGLPVFEAIKAQYPNHKIVLSFFSPSGYEIRKNSPVADVVVYLPMDTKSNAKHFMDLVHPELVVFVKYDLWPNYLEQVKQRSIRAILISALFRDNHHFFKWHGAWMRQYLKAFEHIFVQNSESKSLLETHGITHVSISGDTRFDRVSNQLAIDNTLDFITEFKQNHLCVVAGSTWPEGEALLQKFINSNTHAHVKFIIAPHDIKTKRIAQFKEGLNKPTVLYSNMANSDMSDAQVFIVDTIGILSKIYSYADIAYVGGAMGQTGLHNTLEPAVFGVPIIIGPHHEKFPEAAEMIANKGMFSIGTEEAFNAILERLITDTDFRNATGNHNKMYVEKQKGAIHTIMAYLSAPRS